MPRYRVDVVQTAAYSTYEVALQAANPEAACRRAIAYVRSGEAGEGRFVHTGSAPDDVRSPYAVEVREVDTGNPAGTLRTLPMESGEIGAQFPQVAKLLAAARKLSDAVHAEPLSIADALRTAGNALADLDVALQGFRDHV